MQFTAEVRLVLGALVLALVAELSMPASASADDHEDWELRVGSYPGPLQGACGARLEVRAWGFPADSEVVIGLTEAGSFSELTRVAATEHGFVLFDLVDPYPSDCAPGTALLFAARVAVGDDFLGNDDGPFEVTALLEMRPPSSAVLTAVAEQSGSCDQVRVAGRGFPPGRDVILWIGDATPTAHDFAPIVTVPVDDDGEFTVTTSYFSIARCESGDQIGIYASIEGATGDSTGSFPRVSTIFEVGVPAAAAAGGGVLATSSDAGGMRVLWLAGVTLLLITTRAITRRVPR